MIVKLLHDDGKVKVRAQCTQLVTRDNRILLMEIASPAKTTLNAFFAHIVKNRKGQYNIALNIQLGNKFLSVMPGERFRRLYLSPTNIVVLSVELSMFESRAIFCEEIDPDTPPPHFVKMLNKIVDVPFLPEWKDWLWLEGKKEGRIKAGDDIVGNAQVYYLTEPGHQQRSWDDIIINGVKEGHLTLS